MSQFRSCPSVGAKTSGILWLVGNQLHPCMQGSYRHNKMLTRLNGGQIPITTFDTSKSNYLTNEVRGGQQRSYEMIFLQFRLLEVTITHLVVLCATTETAKIKNHPYKLHYLLMQSPRISFNSFINGNNYLQRLLFYKCCNSGCCVAYWNFNSLLKHSPQRKSGYESRYLGMTSYIIQTFDINMEVSVVVSRSVIFEKRQLVFTLIYELETIHCNRYPFISSVYVKLHLQEKQ